MKAYYGKSGVGYYYSLRMGNIEVGHKRNLTYEQLQAEMKRHRLYKWIDESKQKKKRNKGVSIMPPR